MLQVLNAAAALLVSGRVHDLAEGIALARETHRLGKALDTLDCWISVSNVSLAITWSPATFHEIVDLFQL